MVKLRFIFVTEGNKTIGMGHVYNCICIANKIKQKSDSDIIFIIGPESKAALNKIKSEGYKVIIGKLRDPEIAYNLNPDAVINDILSIPEPYTMQLKNKGVFVINIKYTEEEKEDPADMIINLLYGKQSDKIYTGYKYSLLSDSFKNLEIKEIKEKCENIFVCFGGADPKNLSLKCIKVLDELNDDVKVVVLLGPSFNNQKLIEEELFKLKNREQFIIKNDEYPIKYMIEADLAIVSGGRTICELAATRTPTLILSQNKLEYDRLNRFADLGCISLGNGTKISEKKLALKIKSVMNNFSLRKSMSEKGNNIIDGFGCDRLVSIMLKKLGVQNEGNKNWQ